MLDIKSGFCENRNNTEQQHILEAEMGKSDFKASLNRSKGRSSWCVIFRHPLLMTSDDRPGKRVRRGLGTSDDNEAQRLIDQLNEILGDEAMWSPSAKEAADRKYDKRIVGAFYDNLTPALHDPRKVRDNFLPLPGKDDGHKRILFLGTTGAGKTTLLRQMIGTDPLKERFPSISPAKTTICDIEIVTDPGPFKAVITFFPKEKVRHYIEECVLDAVMEHIDGSPTLKVAKRFLEHKDQRFRLSYVLGSMQLLSFVSDEDELSDEGEDDTDDEFGEIIVSDEDLKKLSERLNYYLDSLKELAVSSKSRIVSDLGISNDEALRDWEAIQELIEYELLDLEEFHQLVDEILDDVETRFSYLDQGKMAYGRDGWPSHWAYETKNRHEFITTVNRFSSNYAPNFGRLLTPLVDGIRVSGPFKPEWWGDQADPKYVLLDGEGLGHTAESASSISTSTTRRYEEADVILLVDNAAQPMQAPPLAVFRSLISSGYESKLITCFTHFDELKGDNLPNTTSKKSHVLYSVDGAIAGISKILGRSAENALKKATTDRVFFLSNIQNRISANARLTRSELFRMLECVERVAYPEFAETAVPIYDVANLVLSIQQAAEDFHNPWRARLGLKSDPETRKEHWARIKALSRRLGILGEDEYNSLRPVADLIARLSEHISKFLSEPLKWKPENPSEDIKLESINIIEREVFKLLDKFTSDRLFLSKVNTWSHAYSAHRGPGSTIHRAYDIRDIYNAAAPIPGEVPSPDANQFLGEIRQLVKDAIKSSGGKMVA